MNEELKKQYRISFRSRMSSDDVPGMYEIGWEFMESLIDEEIDRATLAERKRIVKALKDNWPKLMGTYMAASMQGNLDEQWDKVFAAIEKGES